MSVNEYRIIGRFVDGGIISNFNKLHQQVQKTERSLGNLSRESKRGQAEMNRQAREGERIQKQFWRDQEREARRSSAEAVRAAREASRALQRTYQQNLSAHRSYIQQMKKQESQLHDRSQKATRAGAAGAIGLGLTAGGLKVAGDLEGAMTDLRISIMRVGADGQVDMAGLNAQMKEFETLAIRLGNTLPGSTRTMTELFRSMREGGMDAKQILMGAGEAAALLAVTSKEDFAQLGKVYAQLTTMAQVKPEDQVKTADLLSRINTVSGYKPSELIDAAKYAVPRGGLPLGLKGFSGLSSTLQLLGLMKRYGQEGSVGGEGIANLMERLPMSTPKAKKAGQQLGLQFFDKKGSFLGVENMVAQFEKINQLSTKGRSKALHDIFGAQGTTAAVALGEIGLKGFKQYDQELNQVANLNQKAALETSKFSTQLENLAGTADNVIGKSFGPMMESLKPTLTGVNDLLGKFGNFMGEHPTVAKYATAIFAIGSASVITTAGFIKIQTAVNLWKITSAITSAENRLLAGSFTGVGASAAGASRGVDAATGSIKRASLAGTLIRTGLYSALILSLEELARQAYETDKALSDMNTTAKTAFNSYNKLSNTLQGQGKGVPTQITDSYAAGAIQSLDVGGMFVTSLKDALTNETSLLDMSMTRSVLGVLNPLAPLLVRRDRVEKATGILTQRSSELANPDIMRLFIGKINSGAMSLDAEAKERLMKALATAFPASFKEATEQLSQQQAASAAMLRSQFLPAISDASKALSGLSLLQPLIPPSSGGTGGGPRLSPPGASPKRFFNSSPIFRIPASYSRDFNSSLSDSPVAQTGGLSVGSVSVPVTVQGDASPGTVSKIQQAVAQTVDSLSDQIYRNVMTRLGRDTRDKKLVS
jgi:TP901 family phage tail tape measure protein